MKFYENPREFLAEVGWNYKRSAENYIVKCCPFCRDERGKFAVAVGKPVFRCYHCDESGNLYQLSVKLDLLKPSHIVTPQPRKAYEVPTRVEETYAELFRDTQVQDYLKSRGLTGETVKHFRLGAESNYGSKWVVIPHQVQGKVVNCKYRRLPPVPEGKNKYRRFENARSVLFNADSISKERVVITEGEFDTMVVCQEMGLSFPAVSGTTGAKAFDPEWVDQLKEVRRILICFDRDEDGQKGARDLARRLGYDRCRNILLPEGDLNELLLKEGSNFKARFQTLLEEATKFDIDGIGSAEGWLEAAFTFSCREEDTSPWVELNKRLNIGPGHLICLSADPKIGKTSMALEWCRHRVNVHEEPVFFYCLEMLPEVLVRKIIQLQFDLNQQRMSDHAALWRSRAGSYFVEHENRWFLSNKRFPEVDEYFQLIRDAVRRYGFKWVVFDHFHKLVRSLSNTTQEQANLAVKFKELADELEITLLLVVQPRKPDKLQAIRLAEDMAGSHQIRAEADHILTLSRERLMDNEEDTLFSPETIVRVESRHSQGGTTPLYFHGATQKFQSADWDLEQASREDMDTEVFG